MEKDLHNILDDTVNVKDIIACIVSDKQGLCLAKYLYYSTSGELSGNIYLIKIVKGEVTPNTSGVLTAIVDQARNLNPSSKEFPIVLLETNKKQCIIQSNDKLVVSIVKSIESFQ